MIPFSVSQQGIPQHLTHVAVSRGSMDKIRGKLSCFDQWQTAEQKKQQCSKVEELCNISIPKLKKKKRRRCVSPPSVLPRGPSVCLYSTALVPTHPSTRGPRSRVPGYGKGKGKIVRVRAMRLLYPPPAPSPTPLAFPPLS